MSDSKIRYLVTTKSKYRHNLSKSNLSPKKSMLFDKDLSNRYKEYLVGLVMQEETFDFTKIIPLITLIEFVKHNEYPVRIDLGTNNKDKELLLCGILNDFINDNLDVLKRLYGMYVSKRAMDRSKKK